MKYQLDKHVHSDKVKWGICFLCIIILIGSVAFLGTQLFVPAWDVTPKEDVKETPKADIIDNSGNEMTDQSKVYALPTAMVFASKVNMATPGTLLYTVNVSATITPADATYKMVDWSVSFVNPSSAWATGKSIADYVTVTPTADGALTSAVKCFAPFGEQIKITVTSRDNTSATANCTVDYQKRLIDVKLTVSNINGDGGNLVNRKTTKPATLTSIKFYKTSTAQSKYTGVVTYVESVGTINNNYTSTVNFGASNSFESSVLPSVYPESGNDGAHYNTVGAGVGGLDLSKLPDANLDWLRGLVYCNFVDYDTWDTNNFYNKFISRLTQMPSINFDLINFKVTTNYGSTTVYNFYYASLDITAFRIAVTSITLGGPVIF